MFFSALGDPHVIRRISVRAAWDRSVIQVIRRSQRVNRRSTLSLTRKLIIEINCDLLRSLQNKLRPPRRGLQSARCGLSAHYVSFR